MLIKEFLEKVCNEIKYKPIQSDISEELENHIEEIKEEQLQKGLEICKAEEIAVKQMGEPVEIGKRLNKIHRPRLDWKLLIIVLVLLAFGILVSFIRTQNILINEFNNNYVVRNVLFLIIGLVLSIGIYFYDYTKLAKYSNYIYLFATIVCLFALFGGSASISGKMFLKVGLIFMPLEKIVLPFYIVAFAGFINNYDKNKIINISDIKINIDLVKILVSSFLSMGLMILIPSLISAIILALIYLILATVKIVSNKDSAKRNLTILYGIILLIVFYMIFLNPYRIERLNVSFNPEIDPEGGGWIVMQQRKILNSANFIGRADDLGLALNVFDEGCNYALLSIIAHYGIIPAIILIIVVIAFSSKIVYNSKIVKQLYGKYLLIGLGCLFIIESIVNILMNLTIGIQINSSLPFVSYGGTGQIMNMICIAMILSVYRRKNICKRA